MVRPDCYDIVSVPVDIGSDVIQEGSVAAGPFSEKVAVDVYFASVIYTLEIDINVVFCDLAAAETLPVPANATGKVACAACQMGGEVLFYGPVVGEVGFC